MKCAMCEEEVGNLYCAKCADKLKRESRAINFSELFPALLYDRKTKLYHAGCTVGGCPCNNNGVCMTGMLFPDLIRGILHDFDGDNCIQQGCG